jgi:hypothetical protein
MPIKHLGFMGFSEFMESLLRPKLMLNAWLLWVGLTPLFTFIETYLGITGPIFITFFALNIVELFTGIKASVTEGKALASDKMQRFFFKFFVYVTLIAATYQYKLFTASQPDTDWSHHFFGWAHSAILSGLSIILIRSIFENLHRMGVKEAGIIYGLLDNKWTQALAILVAPPDKDKSERK